MDTAVPRDIDEANEHVAVARAHPPEAVPRDLCGPIILEHAVSERLRVQLIHLGVVESAAPAIVRFHRV